MHIHMDRHGTLHIQPSYENCGKYNETESYALSQWLKKNEDDARRCAMRVKVWDGDVMEGQE